MGAQRFNPGGLQRTSKGKIHFQLNVPYTDSPCTLQSKQPWMKFTTFFLNLLKPSMKNNFLYNWDRTREFDSRIRNFVIRKGKKTIIIIINNVCDVNLLVDTKFCIFKYDMTNRMTEALSNCAITDCLRGKPLAKSVNISVSRLRLHLAASRDFSFLFSEFLKTHKKKSS